MATSIPIKDLKSTGKVLALCESEQEPVLVTKNGYPAFYLVKPEEMDALNRAADERELYALVERGERDFAEGRSSNAHEGISRMRARHGL